MKPVVDGDAPHRSSDATFHERSQHTVGGKPLDVEAHRLEHDIVGELRTCTRLDASVREAALTRLAGGIAAAASAIRRDRPERSGSCLCVWYRGSRIWGSGPDVFSTLSPFYPVVYRIATAKALSDLGFRAQSGPTQLDAVDFSRPRRNSQDMSFEGPGHQ